MTEVPVFYYSKESDPFSKESEVLAWLNQTIVRTDYRLVGTLTDDKKVVLISDLEIECNWVRYVRFENVEDAMAFKLRFGL